MCIFFNYYYCCCCFPWSVQEWRGHPGCEVKESMSDLWTFLTTWTPAPLAWLRAFQGFNFSVTPSQFLGSRGGGSQSSGFRDLLCVDNATTFPTIGTDATTRMAFQSLCALISDFPSWLCKALHWPIFKRCLWWVALFIYNGMHIL